MNLNAGTPHTKGHGAHSKRDIVHDELVAELRRMSCTTQQA